MVRGSTFNPITIPPVVETKRKRRVRRISGKWGETVHLESMAKKFIYLYQFRDEGNFFLLLPPFRRKIVRISINVPSS